MSSQPMEGNAMKADEKLEPPVRCGAEENWPASHKACGAVANLMRFAAVVSLFAAIAWMGRGEIALFAIVFLALLVPRMTLIPRPFDAVFCATLLFATWAAVEAWYQQIHWLDDVVHFTTNGAVAGTVYLVLARINLVRGSGGMGLQRSLAAPVILTTLMGLAIGVMWEFSERVDTILNPNTMHSYADTVGDMAGGGLGSFLAGLAVLWLLTAERDSTEASDVESPVLPSRLGMCG
ncbi:hypothetical protein [Arthrobacter monumenti]